MKISKEEALKELERELEMRKQLYPKWVQSGKMHKVTAERQYLRLEAAIAYLNDQIPVVRRPEQGSLF